MARQIAAALEALGHAVTPVSEARAYLSEPDEAALARRKAEAEDRLARLEDEWQTGAARPELWFTYHSYYKAPDLLGPQVRSRLDIPYVVAEASDSQRRAIGEWAQHVALARAGFAAADLHLCFTDRDRQGIEPHAGARTRFLAFPPFITAAGLRRDAAQRSGPLRLICVAMMRAGVKRQSYEALARILRTLLHREWTLTIVGDGSERDEIRQSFAAIPAARLAWTGALPAQAVAEALSAHDVFVWPGLGEAYGLVYLEAQAAGLPVVAYASGGVPATLRPGETGLLAPEGDEAALAAALDRLLTDPALRLALGEEAAAFIARERLQDSACRILSAGFDMIAADRAGAGS
ncbi:MAG: glycosyltransferase family 4 protein [Bosea sp. (in: a-proteobacteria)]